MEAPRIETKRENMTAIPRRAGRGRDFRNGLRLLVVRFHGQCHFFRFVRLLV